MSEQKSNINKVNRCGIRQSRTTRLRRNKSLGRSILALSTATTATIMLGTTAQAASYYWDTATTAGIQGGNGTWDASTTPMWSSSTAGSNPLLTWVTGDDAIFEGGNSSVSVSGTVAANSIQNTVTSGEALVFGGTGIIQLGAGGMNVQNGGSGLNFNSGLGLALSANQSWTPGNNGGITIASNITETGAGGYTVTEVSSGYSGKKIVFSGTNAFGNFNMSDGNGGFSLQLAGGSTTLSGTLNLQTNTGSGDTFQIGTSTTTAATLSANVVTQSNTANLSTIDLGTLGIFIVGANGGSSNFANPIADETTTNLSTETGTFVKAGSGTVTLNGANTWHGSLNVSGGTLNLNNSGAVANVGNGNGSGIYFTGGTLQYSSNSTADLSAKMLNSTLAPISIDTNSQIVTYATALSSTNTDGLTKLGLGTLNLSAVANYGGNTTISAGTLKISGLASTGLVSVSNGGTLANYPGSISIGGGLNLASGGTVNMENGTVGDTLTLGAAGLSVNGGSTLKFDAGSAGADSINSDGAYTFGGTGTASINIQNLAGFASGVYNLISNAPGISASSYSLATTIPGFALSLNASSGTLQLDVSSSAPAMAFWTGSQSTVWSTLNNGNTTNFNTDATSGINTVTLPAGPTTVVFAANGAVNTSNTTLGANFSIQSLVITTSSAVGIGGSNTLTINGDSGANGITLNSSAGTTTISASSLVLGGSESWTNNSSNPLLVSSVVSGSNSLTLAGSGVITLFGANTFNGGLSAISGSSVKIANPQALGLGAVTINGTLDLNAQTTTAIGTLAGSGTITNTNASAATLTTTTGSFSGIIQNGAGTVALNQAFGMLVLNNANSFTGGTTILGTLQLGNGSSNGTVGSGPVTDNGTLLFNNPGSQTFSNTINGSGGLIASGSNELTLSGSNSYTGSTTVSASATLQMGSATALGSTSVGNLTVASTGTLDLNGNNLALTDNGANVAGTVTSTTGAPVLTFNAATGNITLATTTSLTGSLALNKSGGSTLTIPALTQSQLQTQYSYAGGTNVSGGVLALTAPSNFAGNLLGTGTITTNAGGTLSLSGPGNNLVVWENNFVFNGGTFTDIDGNVELGSGGTITVNGTNTFNREYSNNENNPSVSKSLDFTGQIGGSGTMILYGISNGYGQGAFYNIDNDANTFSGTVQVNSSSGVGTALVLGSNVADGSTALQFATVDAEGAGTSNVPYALSFFTGTTSPVIGALKGTAPITLVDGGGSSVTLSVGNNNLSTTYSGNMNGSGGLTKIGTGLFTFNGSNSYTGTTILADGILAPGALAIPAASVITFTGGTLQHSAVNTFDYSPQIQNSSGAITIDTNSQSVTYATALASSNNGGLTKVGLGTLNLTAAANYSGNTNVSAGTLRVAGINSTGTVTVYSGGTLSGSGTIAGPVIANSGGAIDLRNSTIDTLTLNNGLSLIGGSLLGFDIAGLSGNDMINISSGSYSFTTGSATTSTVDIAKVAGFVGGSAASPDVYNLLTGGGGAVSLSQFTLGTTLPGYNLALAVDPTNSILELKVIALSPAVEYWHGSRVSGNGTVWTAISGSKTNWDTDATSNIDAGAIPTLPTAVIFSANAATAASMAATTLGADTSVMSLEIATANPVGIGGANNLTIAGNNVSNGIIVDSGGGATTITTSGIILNTSQNWLNNSVNLLSISSAISGAGESLSIGGTGKTFLSGVNTFNVSANVLTGATLEIGNAQSLGLGMLAVNGTLDLNGQTTIALGVLSGSGTITNSNASTATLTSTGGAFAGVIQDGGAGKLTALNLTSGTLTLTALSTATGGTTIASGATLQLGNGNTSGGIAGAVVDSGTLLFSGPGTQTLGGTISSGGAVTVNTAGSVVLSGSNSYSGPTTITAGTLQAGAANALGTGSAVTIAAPGVLDLNSFNISIGSLNGSAGSTITNTSSTPGIATLTVTNGGTAAGTITDGTAGGKTALAVNNAGTLTITNTANNYSGGTSVSAGATLQIGNGNGATGGSRTDSSIGSGLLTVGGNSSSQATLLLNTQAGGAAEAVTFLNAITLNGYATVNDLEGQNTVTGAFTINGIGNTITTQYGNKPLNIAGSLSGSGAVTIGAYSGGAFTNPDFVEVSSSGNTGYMGTVTLNANPKGGEQLYIASNTALPNAAIVIVGTEAGANSGLGNAGAVVFASGVNAPVIGSLSSTTLAGSFNSGDGSLVLQDTLGNAAVLTTGGNNNSTIYSGVLSGTGGLIKAGSGNFSLTGTNTYSGGTTASVGTLTFGGPKAFPSFTSLNVSGSALAVAANHGSSAKNNLFISTLNIAGVAGAWTGTLDLANNDADIQTGSFTTLTSQIRQGYNNGAWNGSGGIVSTAAAIDTTHLTALGLIQNNQSGSALYTASHQFDGITPGAGDYLIKYTYYGDTNLDGEVDGTDYSRIDSSFSTERSTGTNISGWYNGDFNYDGVVDGSDYTLMDNAFNTQGTQIAAEIASPTAQIAVASEGTSAVPEPTTLGLLGIGAVGLLGRRRRK